MSQGTFNETFIGRECEYRRLYTDEIKTSKVERIVNLTQLEGKTERKVVFFVMENGDKVPSYFVLFKAPTTSVDAASV